MAGNVSPSPVFHWSKPSGAPAYGYKLYTYSTGTTTPLTTYTNAALTVAATNPVILDVNGNAAIYLSPVAYKLVLTTDDDEDVQTFDPVYGIALSTDLTSLDARVAVLEALSIVTLTGTQTLTNKTLTSPTITSPTITGPGSVQIKASTAAFDVDSGTTGTTLTNITGLTGISLVAGATYKFRVVVPVVVMTTNCGLKMAFKFTTATLTSINARVYLSTDTDNTGAVSTSFVTATDAATWFAQNAVVYTQAVIEGTMIVNAAGTVAVQAAQNAAHADNTTIAIGAFAEFIRVS
jgi:hypothetical protein